MHKSHIFDKKNNAIFFYRPTDPIFSQKPLQETNNIFFLVLKYLGIFNPPREGYIKNYLLGSLSYKFLPAMDNTES